jgi:hypothetical protein
MVKTKILGKPGQPSFRGDVNQCPTCFTVFNSSPQRLTSISVGPFTARRCLSDDEMLAKIGMGPEQVRQVGVSSLMTADDQVSELRINALKKGCCKKTTNCIN